MSRQHGKRRGSAIIEMTLVGIPIIFTLISIFEMSRGMWIYHTLSYGAREGTRYMAVHGVDCQTTPNACAVKEDDLARVLSNATTGLTPDQLKVQFTSTCPTPTTCADTIGVSSTCFLSGLAAKSCANAGTCTASLCGSSYPCGSSGYIPTCGGYALRQPITIKLYYPFNSAIAMFWPGAGGGFVFAPVTLGAISTDYVQF